MNKILKRLFTGVLTLATVFTALPTTAVHAAETQYWTESGERVENNGSISETFNEGQDLGQFYVKLAVGNGKIQKSSSNTVVTNGNDCYSFSGATYGVYSDKGCTKSVATLTTNTSGIKSHTTG